MLKRVVWVVLVLSLLAVTAVYVYRPVGAVVWFPSQISQATVGHASVPPERFGELLRDLRRGTNSKCPTDVKLVLRSGVELNERMDPILAAKYEKDGCGG